jgi:hypothetical protein
MGQLAALLGTGIDEQIPGLEENMSLKWITVSLKKDCRTLNV